MKTFLAVFTLMAILAVPAHEIYSSPPAAAEAEKTDVQAQEALQHLKIVNREIKDPTKNLPKEFAFVAKAFPSGTTFSFQGDTLTVGVKVKKAKPNATLATIDFSSDCPNNSQFGSEVAPSIAHWKKTTIPKALLAWTRWRHDALDAKLLIAKVSPKNYDIRLRLNSVSLR